MIQRGIALRKEGSFESAFQIFDLAYGLLRENLSSLFHIADCNLDAAQKKAATESVSQVLKSLEIALKSDRTCNPNRDKRGSFNIFSSILDLLHKLHAKSAAEAPRTDPATQQAQLAQKRRQLYRAAIDRMMALDTTRTFSQPVDAALVPDYYTVVKKPMDLSRMRQRAERYEAARDMRPDIDLIVANALYYNGAQSPIAQAAVNLKNGWLECCLKCELQEKALLKATPTTPTSPTFSTSLSFVLVALAVVLATPALYAQLLRAVYQRVVFLLSNSTMPSENNVLDPVLFAYYQLLTLPDHLDDLVARTAGSLPSSHKGSSPRRPRRTFRRASATFCCIWCSRRYTAATGRRTRRPTRRSRIPSKTRSTVTSIIPPWRCRRSRRWGRRTGRRIWRCSRA